MREAERLQARAAATREYLQSVIEQQEASNEELQSANEEIQSANEELQSINEELETSKEEIESTNEELSTVNDELQHRNLELTQSTTTCSNLLNSVQLAIVMLGRDLRIRRFTPPAEQLLNLMPSDVGRPISDIKLKRRRPRPGGAVARGDRHRRGTRARSAGPARPLVLGAHAAVQDARKPDRRRGDGAGRHRQHEARCELGLRESEERFELLADSAPVLIWVMGLEGAQFVNRAYADFVGVPEARLQRFDWTKFIHPQDQEAYVGAYLDALARKTGFDGTGTHAPRRRRVPLDEVGGDSRVLDAQRRVHRHGRLDARRERPEGSRAGARRRPTAARTSSSRCCRTSCAIRWPRCATRCTCCRGRRRAKRPSRRPRTSWSARCATWCAWSTTCSMRRASRTDASAAHRERVDVVAAVRQACTPAAARTATPTARCSSCSCRTSRSRRRRSGAAGSDRLQPARQRVEIFAARRRASGSASGRTQAAAEFVEIACRDEGAGHRPGISAAHLRPVRARQRIDRPLGGRHGYRAEPDAEPRARCTAA